MWTASVPIASVMGTDAAKNSKCYFFFSVVFYCVLLYVCL